MKKDGVLIVGGGLAAQRCAETLRRRGFGGPVRILSAEARPPYDRPPLSKGVLSRAVEVDDLAYRGSSWYEDAGIELQLGSRAAALDPRSRLLTLDCGTELRYDKLLIATGGSPRRLGFLDGFENVHYLRALEDAVSLRSELSAGAALAIVGAGFIGQEVAATARRLGASVTMIEAMPTPLAPILGERLGAWFAGLHGDEGVRVLAGAGLKSARGGARVEELVLEDGSRIACDAVLAGVGTVPSTAWLRGSGLDGNGVRTDARGGAGCPDVFAAGDAAVPFDPRFGVHARTEHWDAAAWQGAAAARAMLGEHPGTPPLPSFWSDQYGLRIQYVGHAHRAEGVVFEGDPAERDFEAVFVRAGVPVAGLTVGRSRSIPALRRRIERGHSPANERKEMAA